MSAPSFTNHLLIAMPALSDPNFSRSVALVFEHTPDNGALGIVLNKPLPMRLKDVLSQMQLEPRDPQIAAQPVLRGGPMRTDHGFVLHRPGGKWDSTIRVSEMIQVTTSRDVLEAMAIGEGPGDAFIALGYAGWDPGQLEREIRENAWLPIPADERVVFELPFDHRWQGSWELLGLDTRKIKQLSLVSGNA
jgi:putative transcriptional regulator